MLLFSSRDMAPGAATPATLPTHLDVNGKSLFNIVDHAVGCSVEHSEMSIIDFK